MLCGRGAARLCAAAFAGVVIATCGDTPTGPDTRAPIVSSITPNAGSAFGGTDVVIRGLHFTTGAAVSIGGRPAIDVSVQSSDVISAKSPVAAAVGPANVVVTTGAGSGMLAEGFRYTPADNAPPVITSMTARGSRANQPADFADLGESLTVSAQVTDSETPLTQLSYQWSATLGTFIGQGPAVTWRAPATAATPVAVTLTLRVVELYGANGALQHEVSRLHTLSLHDSPREVGDMARRFLTEFSQPQTNQDWRSVMRDFDFQGRTCPDPRQVEEERLDVVKHYTNFVMHQYAIGAASVTVDFGQLCPVGNRPGDACVSVPVSWDSTDTRTNVRQTTTGVDYLSAAYSSSDARWWLCSSDFPGSAQAAGHSFYRR